MDWSKVDAGLAAALADGAASDRYVVFVHPAPAEAFEAGAPAPRGGRAEAAIRTATVTAEEVERLSEQAEIGQIRLSRALRPTGPT